MAKPSGGVDESELAMVVLRELTGDPAVPPDIQGTAHACRTSLVSGGGTMSNEQPSACRTLERLADLCGRLSGFEIDDEAQADARRTDELILPQARSFAGGADDVADLGRCQSSSGHDISRSGISYGFLKCVNKNIPIGNLAVEKNMQAPRNL